MKEQGKARQESTKKDSSYYLIPQLEKVVPYHGGHYKAAKLLAQAGLHSVLVPDLIVISEAQRQMFFPLYTVEFVEREVIVFEGRRNKIDLCTPLQVAVRSIAKQMM